MILRTCGPAWRGMVIGLGLVPPVSGEGFRHVRLPCRLDARGRGDRAIRNPLRLGRAKRGRQATSGVGRRGSTGARQGRGISQTLLPFRRPALRLLRPMRTAPIPPFGIGLACCGPAVAPRDQRGCPPLPVGGIGRLASLVLRGAIQVFGAPIITCRVIGALPRQAVLDQGTRRRIDPHQCAIVIGVGVIRIFDQEGRIGARLVIIITRALGQPFDHAIGAVIGAPDPRSLTVIIDRIIGRRVAEGVGHVIGIGQIAITLARRTISHPRRGRRRRQRGCRWRITGRRWRRSGELQRRDRRSRDRLLRLIAVARGQCKAGQSAPRQTDCELVMAPHALLSRRKGIRGGKGPEKAGFPARVRQPIVSSSVPISRSVP